MPYDLTPLEKYFRSYPPEELARYIRQAVGKRPIKDMGESYYALNWLAQELDFIKEKKGGRDA